MKTGAHILPDEWPLLLTDEPSDERRSAAETHAAACALCAGTKRQAELLLAAIDAERPQLLPVESLQSAVTSIEAELAPTKVRADVPQTVAAAPIDPEPSLPRSLAGQDWFVPSAPVQDTAQPPAVGPEPPEPAVAGSADPGRLVRRPASRGSETEPHPSPRSLQGFILRLSGRWQAVLAATAFGILVAGAHHRNAGFLPVAAAIALLSLGIAIAPVVWQSPGLIGWLALAAFPLPFLPVQSWRFEAGHAFGCVLSGIFGAALPVVSVAWLQLKRKVQVEPVAFMAAALAGGICAQGALELTCPSEAAGHILLFHVLVTLVLAVGAGQLPRVLKA